MSNPDDPFAERDRVLNTLYAETTPALKPPPAPAAPPAPTVAAAEKFYSVDTAVDSLFRQLEEQQATVLFQDAAERDEMRRELTDSAIREPGLDPYGVGGELIRRVVAERIKEQRDPRGEQDDDDDDDDQRADAAERQRNAEASMTLLRNTFGPRDAELWLARTNTWLAKHPRLQALTRLPQHWHGAGGVPRNRPARSKEQSLTGRA